MPSIMFFQRVHIAKSLIGYIEFTINKKLKSKGFLFKDASDYK
jgi:hypothetical protein